MLLEVRDLQVHYGKKRVVHGVNFTLNAGEVLAIVGESGSGKTATAQAILQLQENAILSGEILWEGVNLLGLPASKMRQIRGSRIGMIFQDPMASLNPTMRVGRQIAESLQLHRQMDSTAARQEVLSLLEAVGISQPEVRIDQYPHEYSGGMRQRAMIAIALACRPALLIADEPTTALDVTIQAQILRLLKQLGQKVGSAILLISHDLAVVAGMADRVAVMSQGNIVEINEVDALFYHPVHPYTQSLLSAARRS